MGPPTHDHALVTEFLLCPSSGLGTATVGYSFRPGTCCCWEVQCRQARSLGTNQLLAVDTSMEALLKGAGSAQPKRNRWLKATRRALLIGVIKQMEHDYSEYTEDPRMLEQLVELEDEVTVFWTRIEEICQREAADSSLEGINLETYRQVREQLQFTSCIHRTQSVGTHFCEPL